MKMKNMFSVFVASFLVSLAAFGQNLCAEVLSGLDQQATVFYEELKAKDPATLKLKSEQEKDLFLRHLHDVAQGRPILIFTDASFSQTSGVVTMMKIFQEVEARFGLKLKLVVPEDFKYIIKTKYQGLVFALPSEKEINTIIERENPFAIHIMVEGSVGSKVRKVLKKQNVPFTTAYHTDFPKIVSSTVRIPLVRDVLKRLTYRVLKSFHRPSQGVMVPTLTMKEELVKNGFDDIELRNWSHGVDIVKFDPSYRNENVFKELPRPISLFVGRVAPEKNIEAFLAMNTPGTKVVIGEGPSKEALQKKYPDAVFLGKLPHSELPQYFASSDVFVFTSLTDTFGLVLLEAAASGTPVLAFDVQGPKDAINSPKAGVLVKHEPKFEDGVRSLEEGFQKALNLDRQEVRGYAEEHSWDTSLLEFLYFLNPLSSK